MPNQWLPWLEEEPGVGYQALIPQTLGPSQTISPNFLQYWQRQFQPVYQQYQGALGQQVLAGGEPTLPFTSYLKNFPWWKRWMELDPAQRGERPSQFASGIRWNV